VTDLVEGAEYTFALKSVDDIPNVSGISNRLNIQIQAIPPRTVDDLAVIRMTSTTATLHWTAPGDDEDVGTATGYDIRYIAAPELGEWNWEGAEQIEDEPEPQAAGEAEEFNVTGLEEGREYAFALETADEVENRSEISNSPAVILQDNTPPAAVTDLEVIQTTAATVTLRWRAPSVDDDEETAVRYDIRYVETDQPGIPDWETARQVEGEPPPKFPGTRQQFTVTGFEDNTGYSLAMKASDERMNWSDESNAPFAWTGTPARGAWWAGFAPYPQGQGFVSTYSTVHSMVVYDGALIVGGSFTRAAGLEARHIAAWDEVSWSPLGTGINGTVLALVEHNGDLVAGGRFTEAGGQPAGNIARWNGSTWEPLGSGVNAKVTDLTEFEGDLIACGDFTRAGAVDVHKLARWDGSEWSAFSRLPVPLDRVTDVEARTCCLYAGGVAEVSGDEGREIHYLARWDGQWRIVYSLPGSYPLQLFSRECRDIRVVGSTIVVAIATYEHQFTDRSFDGVFWLGRNDIPWDPWDYEREGVLALGDYRGDLVIGGDIRFADGTGIARERGLSGEWETFGSGITGRVQAMARYRRKLYVGGEFSRAGGWPSRNIARWEE
jgi:hypothetical protein